MQWEFIVALVIAIPIIAFPVFLWYLNVGDSYSAIRKAKNRRAARRDVWSTATIGQWAAVERGSKNL